MNLMQVFADGDPILIAVFLLLTAMSLTSWCVIFLKVAQLRKERAALFSFHQHVLSRPDWLNTLAHFDTASGSLKYLTQTAIKHHNLLPSDADSERREKIFSTYLSQALDKIKTECDKGLTLLASIGSSAPFIGLFGTVWGIYGALTKIAAEGNASLNVVAGPMGEALVATAIGLFAAIPAVLAYNAFLRQNRLLVQDLRHIAEQMTLSFSSIDGKALNVKWLRGGK